MNAYIFGILCEVSGIFQNKKHWSITNHNRSCSYLTSANPASFNRLDGGQVAFSFVVANFCLWIQLLIESFVILGWHMLTIKTLQLAAILGQLSIEKRAKILNIERTNERSILASFKCFCVKHSIPRKNLWKLSMIHLHKNLSNWNRWNYWKSLYFLFKAAPALALSLLGISFVLLCCCCCLLFIEK